MLPLKCCRSTSYWQHSTNGFMTRFIILKSKILLPNHQFLLPLMLPLRWRNYAMLPLLPLLPRENTTCKKKNDTVRERERERKKRKRIRRIYNIWQHRQHTYFYLSFSRHYAIFRVANDRQHFGNTWQHKRQQPRRCIIREHQALHNIEFPQNPYRC